LAGALVAGCTTTPDAPSKAEITDEVAVEASVLAVDKATRELTLQRPDGTRVVVVAGPEVRNFDQIQVGNKITARYLVTLSARRLEPDEPDTEASMGALKARAEPGQAPAGAIGTDMEMTVVVKSVDRDQHTVVFTDPDGFLHAVEAERDEGKRFVAGLKPGDRVELAYAELLILAVE
jgi:hypothetical protein